MTIFLIEKHTPYFIVKVKLVKYLLDPPIGFIQVTKKCRKLNLVKYLHKAE